MKKYYGLRTVRCSEILNKLHGPIWLWGYAWIVVLLTAGCKYPNQFRDVSANQSHATLTAKGPRAPFTGHLHISAINHQPTSFWKCTDRFRIPPGEVTVHASYSGWDAYGYPPLKFSARPGYIYTVRRQTEDQNRVSISERARDSDAETVLVVTEKESP